VEKQRPEIVNLLLNNGAIVNLLDNDGNTPAHYAKDLPTLRILIGHGARLEITNRLNETPMQTAKKEKRNSIYHYLRLYNITTKDKPVKLLHDRFGAYCRERIRLETEELLPYACRFHPQEEEPISGESLPPLFDELPALEEVGFMYAQVMEKTNYESTVNKKITLHQKDISATTSAVQTEMIRNDETKPAFKVRHIRRLLGSRNTRIPPSPGCHEFESESESDIEKDIQFKKKFGKSEDNDSDENNCQL
jgi:ankyrin repeat protein